VENLSTKQLQEKFAEAAQKIDTAKNNIEINTILQELVTSSLDAEFSSIWFYDAKKFVLLREREDSYVRELDLSVKKGIIYKCFMTQKSSLYNYLASDKDYIASIDNPDGIKIKSKIMLPLFDKENFIGIVTAYNSINKNKKFFKEDMKILEALSPFIVEILFKMHLPTKETKEDTHIIQSIENIQKVQQSYDNNTTSTEVSEDVLTFVSNFVHDIRTPANTLYGFLELLEEQIEDSRLKSYLCNAKESALFINEMTTSVLDLVSNHKESSQDSLEEVDTLKFFSAIAKSFASNMFSKHIAFNVYIDPLLPKSIEIDALKMKRVILNLLGNAYKFTPNNKTIEYIVRYIPTTQKIAISIEDTGIGIPKEKQADIFKAFEQAADTTALNYGGTGLGLFISAQYVQKLGGELQLKSEVDKGSRFSFELPLKIVDKQNCFASLQNPNTSVAIVMDNDNSFTANNLARYMVRMGIKKENIYAFKDIQSVDQTLSHIIIFQHKIDFETLKQITQSGKKVLLIEEDLFSINKDDLCNVCDVVSQYGYIANELYKFINTHKIPKVLVADDDAISVILIENILEEEFCELSIARDGQEALDLIIESYQNNDPFTLIYIDNEMPQVTGIDVMKRVRAYEKEHNLPHIYTVSTSGNAPQTQTNKEYFDYIMGKPFRKDDIKKVLYKHN